LGRTEDLILQSYDAFRRGEVDEVVAGWHDHGELKPLPYGPSYRGREGVRRFLAKDIHELPAFDFRVYTVLEQGELALIFGRYSVREQGKVIDKGIFWIAEVWDEKLSSLEAHEDVGEAMAAFRERLDSR
jgi:ketosteroid isomerase-like protein